MADNTYWSNRARRNRNFKGPLCNIGRLGCRPKRGNGEDRTYKLDFDTVAEYGRYVKSLWEAPWRAGPLGFNRAAGLKIRPRPAHLLGFGGFSLVGLSMRRRSTI